MSALKDNLLPRAEAVVRRAGEIMLGYHDLIVVNKGRHADYVTQADREVQAFLMEELSRLCPEARFFAEEKENDALGDEPTFIIDPIDGTTNFFRRRQASVISVGLTEGKKPVMGLILDPYRGEMFTAVSGEGAFVNGERLHVSDVPTERALVYLGSSSYYTELMEVTGRTLLHIFPHIGDFRRLGSCALELCDVARGRAEALLEWRLSPWDICAGSLIVQEAGGRCGSILEGPVVLSRPAPFLAGNPLVFDRLEKMLRDTWTECQQ